MRVRLIFEMTLNEELSKVSKEELEVSFVNGILEAHEPYKQLGLVKDLGAKFEIVETNHICRMVKEFEELKDKISKGKEFLKSEIKSENKRTNEKQRAFLKVQLCYMDNYADILEGRIEIEKELQNK